MVRNGLLVFLGVGLPLALTLPVSSARGEDSESRLRTQLAVQTALQQGRDNLQRGNYQAAVYCLEKEIARVDGNRDYMNSLREAYRGYIRELQQANHYPEARTYQERLKILDPGYQIELSASRSSAPPAPPTVAALATQTTSAPPTPPKPVESAAPKPSGKYTARPQMPDEQDPFADNNGVQQPPLRDLLDRAKQAFDKKDYAAANRLYEEANRLDQRATAPFREFWAFCKLSRVTEDVNKAGWTPPADAEKEVQEALALTSSPQLKRHGKEMLRRIQDRRIEVRHIPGQGQNWPEAETENFRVIHNQSRELAEQVARIAEMTRAAMTRKWFGEEPTPWKPKCRIILYATADHYARHSGKPADTVGNSTLKSDGERVIDRKIELHCDVANMLTVVLPHETTHAVLSGRFGRHLVPRWADEGMALLSEPRERVDLYLKTLPKHRSNHELFALSKLMSMENYPEPRLVRPFYAQSIGLVEFLSSQKGGPQEFARFVRDGLDNGYEAALRKHYGISDFKDLETRWSAFAQGDASGVAAMYAPGRHSDQHAEGESRSR
jgi:tetratricopeptide (TPR) repeat protein